MRISKVGIEGLLLVESPVYRDARGHFLEVFQEAEFARLGLAARFVQDNVSFSRRGVVRGLHYQRPPHAQGKLVRALAGEIFDVAVDLRPSSPTLGRWHAEILSSENARALWIPEGFAHGFCAVSGEALVLYKCTARYRPEAETGIRWDDPSLKIAWPACADAGLVSDKDRSLPRLDGLTNSGS